MEFRVETQEALELVLAAYYYQHVPAATQNQAEADKILDTNIQNIQTTLQRQKKEALQTTIAISLASTLIVVACLAIAHFFQYPVKIAHEVFTFIKFGTLLTIEVGLLCSVNKKVLGKRTPKASASSLLQEAVLSVVKEETFWIELGAGALLYSLS